MTRNARPLWTALLLATTLSPMTAWGADAPLRLVSVSGGGEVKAQPDMAYVTLGVEARKPALGDARVEVNAAVERLLELTRSLKIEPRHVDSTRLQVQPDYRWDEKAQQQVLLGYVVNRQIEVELHDLDRLGTLLEKAVTAGANQVGAARLDSSRRKELEREALAQAVQDARLNADALARAAGTRLGPVQNISANNASPPMPMYAARMMDTAAKAEAADESYKPAEMKFTANVSAQYELLLQ